MATETGSIDDRRFVTMRFARIKTWGHVYHVRRHNTREMECRHTEADAPGPQLLVGSVDVAGAIRKLLEMHGIKHKAGEVLALEFVVSASRAVFEGIDHEELQRRINGLISCAMRAFRSRFRFPGQIVSVALHKDERTPHLHVVVVPLIEEPDNRRRDRTPFVRLSAKRVVGGRGDMAQEQTRFASFFQEMGLERGRHASTDRHVSNREHEWMLERARQETMWERDRLADERVAVCEEAEGMEMDRAWLDAECEKLSADRADLERRRLTLEVEETAARELKAKVLRRAQKLRELLVLADDLRSAVLAAPARSPAMQRVERAADQLDAGRRDASLNDDWMAALLSYGQRQVADGVTR